MALYGWDASHYDGRLSTAVLARAKAEGITFFHHKVGEGTGDTEGSYDDTALAAARDAGIEFLGAYFVPRTLDPTAQVNEWLTLLRAGEPWLLTWPGRYAVVDLERWKYDNVQASTGIDCARLLRAALDWQVFLYASHGQYFDELAAWDGPLINADYVSAPAAGFAAMYPGDGWQPLHGTWRGGWAPYSGQTPAVLQYTSSAVVAGLTTCDVNAYRGSLDQLRALITGRNGDDDMKTVLVRAKGDPRVYLSNGLVRWHIPDQATLNDVINGVNPVLGALADSTVHEVLNLDAFGVEIPAGLPATIADLAAKVAAAQAAVAPSQDALNAAVLAAMLDPRVQKGIGDTIASHLHVS